MLIILGAPFPNGGVLSQFTGCRFPEQAIGDEADRGVAIGWDRPLSPACDRDLLYRGTADRSADRRARRVKPRGASQTPRNAATRQSRGEP